MRWIEAHLPHDKALHIIAGVVIFAATHYWSWWIGIATVAVVAVVKEALDRQTGGVPSVWDAIATVCGGLLGLLCWVS
ncbi:hypothetical protein [Burkholderia cepacia]|uniref:hypothetical protein n=1 Tax=Burkholderia cepacia TaxID=292 RepID=UPI002ABE2489|nr:hypothetical protein [Burkholderia cepacia]